MNRDKKELMLISLGAAFIASLCCVTPVILVLLGLSTVSFAGALSNTLYYGYRLVFISAGLTFLIIALVYYYRRKGICSIDDVKRNKNLIINLTLTLLIITIVVYLVWNYLILEYIGYWLGVWSLYS